MKTKNIDLTEEEYYLIINNRKQKENDRVKIGFLKYDMYYVSQDRLIDFAHNMSCRKLADSLLDVNKKCEFMEYMIDNLNKVPLLYKKGSKFDTTFSTPAFLPVKNPYDGMEYINPKHLENIQYIE